MTREAVFTRLYLKAEIAAAAAVEDAAAAQEELGEMAAKEGSSNAIVHFFSYTGFFSQVCLRMTLRALSALSVSLVSLNNSERG